jgi:ABC-type multidrug transport system fused ATPase/permease subunit
MDVQLEKSNLLEHEIKKETVGVVIENLYFAYPDHNNIIFNDLNLNIRSGEFTVIKGDSGVGKSTLADLILGILKPDSGRIEYTNFNEGKSKFSYMPQETIIIDGSVIENIALGVPLNLIDLTRIREVSLATGLDKMIDKEIKGNSIKIGSASRILSGGQYQRIGLARALYSDPDLIILDEPTSALDQGSEELILKVLYSLRQTKTIIVIAHSEKPEQFADQIILL